MSNDLLLKNYLKSLRLPTFLKEYGQTARQCSERNSGYEAFLEQLSEREVLERERKGIQRRIKDAKFPAEKDLSGFDFAASPLLNKKRILELSRCEYIGQRENIIFVGPPGTGKTHLAIALGREACRRGKRVVYFSAPGLATRYAEAREQREVLRLEKHIQTRDLIIIDELGYVPLGNGGAENLFSFFSQCYERTSLIITTNLPFSDWPQAFGDERLTGALLDRLTHRVNIIELNGDSYRLKSSLKRQEDNGAVNSTEIVDGNDDDIKEFTDAEEDEDTALESYPDETKSKKKERRSRE